MKQKVLLGYDIGSSSIKASMLSAETGVLVASGFSPEREMKIDSPQMGWAEQHPDLWWSHVVAATKIMLSKIPSGSAEVIGIGISYQMHGLVIVDREQRVLHPSIIWCDSRAVDIGNKAYNELGQEYCLGHCLNSPGNFTASKLKWVKEQRPELYRNVDKIMLPGDYVAMRLTGEICTTATGLSEGILWDFQERGIAGKLMAYYGFDRNLLPRVVPSFGLQGKLTAGAASELGLEKGIPVAYRAGDQPNNALSLNVLNPGEIAATAGTSGVVYGVTEKNVCDARNRVNTFAHVNYTEKQPNKGVLLCINGTGIQYSWLKQSVFGDKYSYEEMNAMGAAAEVGARGLLCFPFGNGAERCLENRDVHAHFSGINFNVHGAGDLVRAAQEGIVFTFRHGLDVMKELGMEFGVIRAGYSNLFQSKVFREAFVNTCNVDLEIYNTDGAQGAARGAGIGIGYYASPSDAFHGLKVIERLKPDRASVEKHEKAYQRWKAALTGILDLLPPGD